MLTSNIKFFFSSAVFLLSLLVNVTCEAGVRVLIAPNTRTISLEKGFSFDTHALVHTYNYCFGEARMTQLDYKPGISRCGNSKLGVTIYPNATYSAGGRISF